MQVLLVTEPSGVKSIYQLEQTRIVADAMDEKRERRFYQKLETLEDRLTFIEENFPEMRQDKLVMRPIVTLLRAIGR